jgi:hypothetical protein
VRVILSPAAVLFPSRVEIGVILSSSAEWLVPSPEGDIFYAFII